MTCLSVLSVDFTVDIFFVDHMKTMQCIIIKSQDNNCMYIAKNWKFMLCEKKSKSVFVQIILIWRYLKIFIFVLLEIHGRIQKQF